MALRTPAFNDAKTYGFEWVRAMIEADSQEGVLNFAGAGTDFKVTAAAGGGMKVDIAAGACLVKGDSGVPATGLTQGLFLAVNDAAVANALTLAASHATLPRISRICLKVRDSADLGTGADDLTFVEVAGAPTSGATLDNESGIAALPNDHIQLSTILIPAASVAVSAGNVRDRRRWAKGAISSSTRVTDFSLTATVGGTAIDTATLQARVECSGAPIRLHLSSALVFTVGTNGGVLAGFRSDGAQIFSSGGNTSDSLADLENATSSFFHGPLVCTYIYTPVAGSHLFTAVANVTGSMTQATLRDTSLIVEELVRPNANNGTT